jgi:excisionase family DNA binding protein
MQVVEISAGGGNSSRATHLLALRQSRRTIASRVVKDEAMEPPAPRSSNAQPVSQVLLTSEEAAAHLKLASKTIRTLCASRRINAIRICRRWRIPAEELEQFKQTHLSRAV